MDLREIPLQESAHLQGESHTLTQLAQLFAREAQTWFRYRWFAEVAQFEGLDEATLLFRRLAENQAVIIEGHFDFLRTVGDPVSAVPIGSTDDNLTAAVLGTAEEGTSLYASIATVAESEGLVAVASWLRSVAAAKQAAVSRIRATQEVCGRGTHS